jgi:hypothetical protein
VGDRDLDLVVAERTRIVLEGRERLLGGFGGVGVDGRGLPP